MFQALTSKVISGVVSLSMLLLSSYEGNIAKFDELSVNFLQNRIVFRTRLLNAFENDFEEIFSSGSLITVHFNISVEILGEVIHENSFQHSVVYNPMKKIYTVDLEDQSDTFVIEDYSQLIEKISEIEYLYNYPPEEEFQLIITAYMDKIVLDTMDKEFDLMMLWKFKSPKLKEKIARPENES